MRNNNLQNTLKAFKNLPSGTEFKVEDLWDAAEWNGKPKVDRQQLGEDFYHAIVELAPHMVQVLGFNPARYRKN
jgi:hypothetical protein